jgi:hypothetical protein
MVHVVRWARPLRILKSKQYITTLENAKDINIHKEYKELAYLERLPQRFVFSSVKPTYHRPSLLQAARVTAHSHILLLVHC